MKSESTTNLGMFLLMAVEQRQPATVYSLYRNYGLSMGSTAPALARLEREGWLASVTGGDRGKISYSLTPGGRQILRNRWKEFLKDYRKDAEEALRVVTLAFALGERSDRDLASAFLEAASDARAEYAGRDQREAELLKELASSPFGLYDWMKSVCSSARKQGEASALRLIAQEIRKEGFQSHIGTNSPTRVAQEEAGQEETDGGPQRFDR